MADTARKTFLLGNEFEKVDARSSTGARSRQRGNRVYQVDQKGEHTTPLPDQDGPRDVPEP